MRRKSLSLVDRILTRNVKNELASCLGLIRRSGCYDYVKNTPTVPTESQIITTNPTKTPASTRDIHFATQTAVIGVIDSRTVVVRAAVFGRRVDTRDSVMNLESFLWDRKGRTASP